MSNWVNTEKLNNAVASAKNQAGAAYESLNKGWGQYPGDNPKDKSAMMKCGCFGGESEDPEVCPYICRLRSDLASFYYWSGNPVKDYFYFVFQWHPLIGILLSHPNHPWNKAERIGMLAISIAYSIIPSASIAETDILAVEQAKGNQAAILAAHAATKTSAILFVTLPNVIMGVILYQIAIADTRCPAMSRSAFCSCCKSLKKCCFGCTFFLALINSIVAYIVLVNTNAPMAKLMKPLVYGLAMSWLTWFPIFLFLPFIGFIHEWCIEKKAWDAGENPSDAKAAEAQE